MDERQHRAIEAGRLFKIRQMSRIREYRQTGAGDTFRHQSRVGGRSALIEFPDDHECRTRDVCQQWNRITAGRHGV